MIKPEFPPIVIFKPEEIRAIRGEFKYSREKFAKFFNVTPECVKAWETGRNPPYGPSGVILQWLKAYVDHVKKEKAEALKSVLGRHKK